MTNTEWKNAYKEGFTDGYAAAKKELNYPSVSYGGVAMKTPGTSSSTIAKAPASSWYSQPPAEGVRTGLSLSGSDC